MWRPNRARTTSTARQIDLLFSSAAWSLALSRVYSLGVRDRPFVALIDSIRAVYVSALIGVEGKQEVRSVEAVKDVVNRLEVKGRKNSSGGRIRLPPFDSRPLWAYTLQPPIATCPTAIFHSALTSGDEWRDSYRSARWAVLRGLARLRHSHSHHRLSTSISLSVLPETPQSPARIPVTAICHPTAISTRTLRGGTASPSGRSPERGLTAGVVKTRRRLRRRPALSPFRPTIAWSRVP